ncbi:hypothetical protein chiPu_0018133, partial [Chiloscyllium punctatum]|nr:hypothetical protein [Chiloscyllium punctatum]
MEETWGVMEETWGVMEETWGVMEETWGVMEETWGVMEETWGVMEETGEVMEETCGVMEERWGVMEERWGVMEETGEVMEETGEVMEETPGATDSAREIFDVFVPGDPITVSVGEDVVLECQVVPDISLNTLEVRWFTSDSASPVHLYTGGQDRPDVQDKDYQGRTELFKDEFPRGNASLKLKKIKVSDEGNYTCYIDSKTHHDQAVIDLKVEDGWYPEPLIHWENGKGEDVTAQSETELIKDSTGLITVQSRINVTSDSVNKFSCFMENQFFSKIQEAHLQISDEFFPKINVVDIWLVIFWVFVVLVIMAIAVDVMIHRKEDKKIKELEWFFTLEGYDKVELNC